MSTVGELGEDALLALFTPLLPESDSTLLGPGDDAAVLSVDGDLVVSSDVLIEGRHFRRDWSTAADIGWRAAMQNLVDIDAMGAVPLALQVTLAMPAATEVDWVLGFARGLREACEPHGVGVVGGDLSAASEIAVSVTVLGETHGQPVVTRADAGPGDVIAVSGPLGAAAAGLAQLLAGVSVDQATIDLFVRPRPRIGAGIEAALSGATALMDISDGLLRDATRMARASDVGIFIDSTLVPGHPGVAVVAGALGVDAVLVALTGGEDHHLLGCFPRLSAVPDGWSIVGEATADFEGVRVDGAVPEVMGWDHFGG